MADHYDAVITGTGAGGGTLANVLAKAGKRILLPERGNFLSREKENRNPGGGHAFQPQVHYFVGGATKMRMG